MIGDDKATRVACEISHSWNLTILWKLETFYHGWCTRALRFWKLRNNRQLLFAERKEWKISEVVEGRGKASCDDSHVA